MDHSLEDTLNLESSIGVDFEHSEDIVVSQPDISIDGGHGDSMSMEYEHIEEQPLLQEQSMLMDTGSEEIIVSDFIGDQFTMQDYSTQQQDQMPTMNMKIENNMVSKQSSNMVDPQIAHLISVPAAGIITEEMNLEPTIISVKAATPGVRVLGAGGVGGARPAQRAIAPKPAKVLPTVQKITALSGGARQYTLAPKPAAGTKPVTLVANKALGQLVAKDAGKGTMLAIGKQLVMMPSNQKMVKLVGSGGIRLLPQGDDQAQLIKTLPTSQAGNKITKVVVKAARASDGGQAVLTKLVSASAPASGAPAPAPRYVTVPHKPTFTVSSGKVVSSPSKGGVPAGAGAGGKPHLVTLRPHAAAAAPPSSASAAVPAPTAAPQGAVTKKIVISANPSTKNIVLKATPKSVQVSKASSGQTTQLHPINVPGKGIQYIRLVTNPSGAAPPAAPRAAPAPSNSKTFVITDGKGNLIQMTAEKVVPPQPPPPLVTTTASNNNKASVKTPQKLVRLAPVSSKLGQAALNRSGQSLLAPLPAEEPTVPVESHAEELDQSQLESASDMPLLHMKQEHLVVEDDEMEEEADSKSALRALIADTVSDTAHDAHHHDQNQQYSGDVDVGGGESEHPLIVVPPYTKQVQDPMHYTEGGRPLVNVEVDVGGVYDYRRASPSPPPTPPSPPPDHTDTDTELLELGMRPRKACNCTKSQCLKLYCDCFANGEFCNRCNCTNCHNNLENEELRQKAIRGCLDRNPNAFRPKIGKAKVGGPQPFRRHNKGCNCKRSGCLKNYCECYEAKIACTNICKCVGCRNVEETVERARARRDAPRPPPAPHARDRHKQPAPPAKQPCSFMTHEVIEAVCQCLVAAAVDEGGGGGGAGAEPDPVGDVLEEFARCLQDIISASHYAPLELFREAL